MSTGYDDAALRAWRAERDEEFTDFASPLPDADLETFTGLRYFPADPSMAVTGQFAPGTGEVPLDQSNGGSTGYRTAGTVRLSLEGREFPLLVFEGDEAPFLPFSDTAAGVYGGGRYAPVTIHDDGTATVDFNRAVNPLCAYDPEFSCPLPPPRNRLPVAVAAGEMAYTPGSPDVPAL